MTSTVEQAKKIAHDAGYETLVSYAAHEVKWDEAWREQVPNAKHVSPKYMSDEQPIVLQALQEQGLLKELFGYHAGRYVPTEELEQKMLAAREYTKLAEQAALIERADRIAAKKNYKTLADYAAAEIAWKPLSAREEHTDGGKYVSPIPPLSFENTTVLDALKLQKEIKNLGGYYGNRYVPEKPLDSAIEQVQARGGSKSRDDKSR